MRLGQAPQAGKPDSTGFGGLMEASDAMLIHANSRNWQAYRPVETVSLEGGVQNTAVMHLPKRHATR